MTTTCHAVSNCDKVATWYVMGAHAGDWAMYVCDDHLAGAKRALAPSFTEPVLAPGDSCQDWEWRIHPAGYIRCLGSVRAGICDRAYSHAALGRAARKYLDGRAKADARWAEK